MGECSVALKIIIIPIYGIEVNVSIHYQNSLQLVHLPTILSVHQNLKNATSYKNAQKSSKISNLLAYIMLLVQGQILHKLIVTFHVPIGCYVHKVLW